MKMTHTAKGLLKEYATLNNIKPGEKYSVLDCLDFYTSKKKETEEAKR
jgi:hypothetical protein